MNEIKDPDMWECDKCGKDTPVSSDFMGHHCDDCFHEFIEHYDGDPQ